MAFARDVYTAGAAQTDYTISFPYQAEEDVTVFNNGSLLTVTTDYTFFNSTTIRLVVASTAGDTVVLQRSTSQSTRDVVFVAGTLTEADLNNAAIQAFYMAQESVDIANIKLGKATDEIWDALSTRIKNVATPTASADAVTKSYVDTLAISGVVGTPVAIADGGSGQATIGAARTAFDVPSNAEAALVGRDNVYTKSETWLQGADVASVADLLVNIDGNMFDITGTTTITAMKTKGVGTYIMLQFDAILTLTHHATDLILPGGANIVTAAGDIAVFYEYGPSDWRCVTYTRAVGNPGAKGGMLQSDQAITSTGTWTKPAGCKFVKVYVTGSGGGGGGGTGGSSSGAGGGAGGTAIKVLDVSAIATATITIGAAGTGGTANGGNASDGADCVWADGTNTLTGLGGIGGHGGVGDDGGLGGLATGGTLNIAGNSGGGAQTGAFYASKGAGSFWGGGSRSRGAAGAGFHATAYGGGGSAAVTTTGAGGNGSTGVVYVEEHY